MPRNVYESVMTIVSSATSKGVFVSLDIDDEFVQILARQDIKGQSGQFYQGPKPPGPENAPSFLR